MSETRPPAPGVRRHLSGAAILFVARISGCSPSFLGPGYASCLAYASRAVMAVVNAVLMPMGRALMPPLPLYRLAARRQYDRLRSLLEVGVIAVGFVLVPVGERPLTAGGRGDVAGTQRRARRHPSLP